MKNSRHLLLFFLLLSCSVFLQARDDYSKPYVLKTEPRTTANQEFFQTLNENDRAKLLAKLAIARQKKKYAKAAKILHQLALHEQQQREKSRFYLEEARMWFLAGKTDQSRTIYLLLLEQFPLYLPYDQVVPELRALAERYVNGDGTVWGLRDKKAAIGVYERIITEAPAIHVSVQDRIRMAELELLMDDIENAIGTYQEILQLAPEQKACRLKLALLLENISHKGDGDGARLRAAQRHARIIITDYPGSPEAQEAQALLKRAREIEAQRLLDLAKFYLGRAQNRPKAAKIYLEELIQEAPDTRAGQEGQKIYAQYFGVKPVTNARPAAKEQK